MAGQREINKGQPEVRVLRSRAASPEAVGFPLVAQVALLRRHLRQHACLRGAWRGRQAPEVVALMTRLPHSELTAAPWLAAHRAAWGIESGLHQRLDVSHRQDACRVRRPRAMRVMAMFRRFSNSLFMEWRLREEEASTQDDHGFFWRHEGRALSLCVPLPSGPPTQPPNPFVNWPCRRPKTN